MSLDWVIIVNIFKNCFHLRDVNTSSFFTFLLNDCDLEPIAYEFFTQAFVLYEEEIAVS